MKNKQLLSGILVLLVCLFCSCKKDKKPEFVNMIFEIPLSITPIKDMVAIGDTLWLEASFPDTIKEHKSGKYYRILPDNFDFQTIIGFFTLVNKTKSLSQQPGFFGAFNVINQVGAITNVRETFGHVMYVHTTDHYHLRIGFIAKQKGVVGINFLNGWLPGGINQKDADISFIDLGQTEHEAKRKPILENIYYVINNGNTNFDLYQQYSKTISVQDPYESTVYDEQKATYTFIVK